jgi:hypothetical protein
MNTLILALASTLPRRTGADPGLAMGAIRWVALHRAPNKHTVITTLAESVYWSAPAMVDDLLRLTHHAVVLWGARPGLDDLVAGTVPPNVAGPYLRDRSAGTVLGVAEQLYRAGQRHWPGVYLSEAPAIARPRGPVQRLVAGLVGRLIQGHRWTNRERDQTGRWMQAHAGYSSVTPAGVGGILHSRAELLELLIARTFDPLAALGELVGHVAPTSLEAVAAALDVKPPQREGRVSLVSDAPMLWEGGRTWELLDLCRWQLDAVQALLHLATFGGVGARLLLDELEEYAGGVPTRAGAYRIGKEGAKHRFALPTGDWWERIEAVWAAQ